MTKYRDTHGPNEISFVFFYTHEKNSVTDNWRNNLKSVRDGKKGDDWEEARLQCVETSRQAGRQRGKQAGIANTFLLSFSAGAVVIVASKRVLLRRGRASKAEESSLPLPLPLSFSFFPRLWPTAAFIHRSKTGEDREKEGRRREKERRKRRDRKLDQCPSALEVGMEG